MWIWSGTPGGHEPPNSEAGKAALNSKAPFAPGRVWASICAPITPSEALSSEPTSVEDRIEADLLGVANALIERCERLALVEIRGVNRVPGCAEFVGERKESGCLSLCVVK